MEDVVILLVIFFFSIIQSIIGIGLLMFGTPTFLLIGYSFIETLNLVLIPSILISLLQVIDFKKKPNKEIKYFKLNFIFFCLPSLIFGLFLITRNYSFIDFELLISLIIIASSIMRFSNLSMKNILLLSNKYHKFYHILIGIIHGSTNMGGAFLSLFSTSVFKKNKTFSRYSVSFAYLVMGLIQFIYINIFFPHEFNSKVILYSLISTITFVFLGNKVFKTINLISFNNLINTILLIYGFLLLSKSSLINYI